MGLIEFIMMLNAASGETSESGDTTMGSEDIHMGDEDVLMGDE